MKIQKIAVLSAGTLMMTTSFTPILAEEAVTINNQTTMQLCEDGITNSADIINSYVDGIEIEKKMPVEDASFYSEVTYTYAEPAYTYEVVEASAEQTMNVDEFMALYAQEVLSVDTGAQEVAYQQALANYNIALTEYEAASQMTETTKEIEVEITEDVVDEEGNITQITRTEIQIVSEFVPAGDEVSAQANLDAASAALDEAGGNLEAVQSQNQVIQEITMIQDQTDVDSLIEDTAEIQ